MSDKEQQAEVTEKVAEAPEQPQGPDLTVQDLGQLRSVIDVASQRGAFKPNEMVTVGSIYNKLDAFLNAVQSQQQGASQGDK